uniref:Uncharacterized protein n=1 Tax=Timema monikensis TaxID=170555 RepID=A0A7R9E2X6_9NEOP|nr:unnamed protein product [Timema monikensis]
MFSFIHVRSADNRFTTPCCDKGLLWPLVSSFARQFTAWVDAVIFVFSLENESSFKAIYNYYTQMAHFRNSAEIPLILVGTQGESH